MSKNQTKLSSRKGLKDNLFEKVGQLAEKSGSPEPEDIDKLAREFLLGPASLYGTATFYDFTHPDNKGKRVYVCKGTACHLAGTQPRLTTFLEDHFNKQEIGEMKCLGRCHHNGAFQYKGQNYSAHSEEELKGILDGFHWHGEDHYMVEARGQAVLTQPFPGLKECRKQIANILENGWEEALLEVENSELRGRGGAGFPVSIKIKACRLAHADQKYVVCNADEGDPGSFSDRYLLEQRPHAVLLGMLIAGFITGAEHGILYIRAEYPEASIKITEAIEELQAAGLAGDNILGSGYNFHFKVIGAKGAYICGEETALLASIEGQRPEARIRPPYPAQEGLFGKPTLINNVETLANLYYILENGGHAFATIGTKRSKGTKLLSLDSIFNRPGVYEVELGMPLIDVIGMGKGFRHPVKAIQVGGPLGGLIPIEKVPGLTVDFESFADKGFLLGHASVLGIPADFPMIAYLEHLFEFVADESCGKCFPCRLGAARGKEMLQKAQREDYHIDKDVFLDLLHTMEKGSLCGLGSGMTLPVNNALDYFWPELAPYFGAVYEPGC